MSEPESTLITNLLDPVLKLTYEQVCIIVDMIKQYFISEGNTRLLNYANIQNSDLNTKEEVFDNILTYYPLQLMIEENPYMFITKGKELIKLYSKIRRGVI